MSKLPVILRTYFCLHVLQSYCQEDDGKLLNIIGVRAGNERGTVISAT